MTDEELWAFLSSRSVAVVSGRAEWGLTARRARYSVVDRRLVLDITPDDGAFDPDRQPDMCVCVDSYPTHDTIRGVIAHGSASRGPGRRLTMTVDRVVSFDFAKAAR
jgi:hypothetical protein